MLAENVSIVVAEVDAVARALPIRASGRAMLVAAAAPRVGVTKVGLVVNATVEDPDSSVNADARFAEDGVARNVATPVPRPDTPVEIGKPVAFVSVPEDGVPRAGVTKVGLVANTNAPVPVSSVIAEIKFDELGVARNVATLAPRPDTPVEIGNPVTFVIVPDAGVPRAGVVSVGEVRVLFVRVCVPSSVTTVESISRVFPVLSNPVPAVICPRPVNCVKVSAVVPIVTAPLFVNVNPESAFTVPSSTNTAKFEVSSAARSASVERSGAPDDLTT